MKRSQIYFTTLLVPVDFAMLVVAAIAAYEFRIDSFVSEYRPVIYTLDFQTYLYYALITALIWILIFAVSGLYVVKSNRKLSQELGKIFIGCSVGLLTIVFLIFLQRELFSSRFIILAAWFFSVFFVFLGRAFVLFIQRQLFKKGYGAIKLIVIGKDSHTQALIDEISKNPAHGFRIVETFGNFSQETQRKILKIHKEEILDEILVADPDIPKEIKLKIIEFTEEFHLGFRYAADMFNAVATNTKVEPIAGIPIVELRQTSLEGWGRVFKRLFDVIVSLFFIILFSPILLLAALAVKLTSPGPIVYKNERVGQRGILFDTLKFRSMKQEYSIGKQFEKSQDALQYEAELIKKQNVRKGAIYKIKDDPRVTKIGKFLRRWSIDELPQFFNVLKGDMSIVGPRPHQPREVEKYERHHKRLLTIKPGITGMAQVSGRSDLPFEDEAKLDLYYIENWTPWLDLQIILKTPIAILRNRKAE